MKSRIFYALLFVLTTFVSNQLVQYFALKSVNVMEIQGVFSPQTALIVTNSNGLHPIIDKTRVNSGVYNSSENQTLKLELQDRVVDRFRLDVHHQQSEFQLNNISLYSHFFNTPISWNAEQIETAFSKQETSEQVTTFILHSPIKGSNFFIFWIIPGFLGLFVVLIIRHSYWKEFPAYQDLRNNQAGRNKNNFEPLDGFRGLAALFVLMHHATMTFKGYGGLGVWMFFVLSGFLLTKAFIIRPEISVDSQALSSFMTRRFKRIVPMYFVMVTAIFLIPHHYETAIRHYLFIQGDGHFWTILEEMYFYLLLPILAMLAYLLFKGRPLPTIIFLSTIAILWRIYGSIDVVTIYGLNHPLRVVFEVFLVGMIGAYWYHGIYSKSPKLQSLADKYQWLLSSIGLIGFFIFIDICRRDNFTGFFVDIKGLSVYGALICLALILLAVVGNDRCWYKKFLSFPLFRYIGIVGYSFYLIHPYSVFISRYGFEHFFAVEFLNVSEVWRLSISFVITLALASFTYSYIERPFLQRHKST